MTVSHSSLTPNKRLTWATWHIGMSFWYKTVTRHQRLIYDEKTLKICRFAAWLTGVLYGDPSFLYFFTGGTCTWGCWVCVMLCLRESAVCLEMFWQLPKWQVLTAIFLQPNCTQKVPPFKDKWSTQGYYNCAKWTKLEAPLMLLYLNMHFIQTQYLCPAEFL